MVKILFFLALMVSGARASVNNPVVELVHQFNSFDKNSTFYNKTGTPLQGFDYMGGAFLVISLEIPAFLALSPGCAPVLLQQCIQFSTGAYYLYPNAKCISSDTPVGAPLGYVCSKSVPGTAPLYLIGRSFVAPNGSIMNHYGASWVAQAPGWSPQFRLGFVPKD